MTKALDPREAYGVRRQAQRDGAVGLSGYQVIRLSGGYVITFSRHHASRITHHAIPTPL
jgi:hypothetical protein